MRDAYNEVLKKGEYVHPYEEDVDRRNAEYVHEHLTEIMVIEKDCCLLHVPVYVDPRLLTSKSGNFFRIAHLPTINKQRLTKALDALSNKGVEIAMSYRHTVAVSAFFPQGKVLCDVTFGTRQDVDLKAGILPIDLTVSHIN